MQFRRLERPPHGRCWARAFTARVAAIGFGVELAFALAIPVAYLRLFDVEFARDRATVVALVGALYLVRTAALVGYLAMLLRPIERWMAATRSRSRSDPETVRTAARAAYDAPLVFALVWATSWLLFYLPVTAVLRSRYAEQISRRAPAR